VSSIVLEVACCKQPTVLEAACIAVGHPNGGPSRLVVYFSLRPVDIDYTLDYKKAFQKLISSQINPLFRVFDVQTIDSILFCCNNYNNNNNNNNNNDNNNSNNNNNNSNNNNSNNNKDNNNNNNTNNNNNNGNTTNNTTNNNNNNNSNNNNNNRYLLIELPRTASGKVMRRVLRKKYLTTHSNMLID